MPKTFLTDEIRYLLLKEIGGNPAMTQREMASVMGVSLGKLNACLKFLIEKGWVQSVSERRSGDRQRKTGYIYILTAKGAEERLRAASQFLQHKQNENKRLLMEIESLRNELAQTCHEFE